MHYYIPVTSHYDQCSVVCARLVAGASAVLDLRLVPVVGLEDLSQDSSPNWINAARKMENHGIFSSKFWACNPRRNTRRIVVNVPLHHLEKFHSTTHPNGSKQHECAVLFTSKIFQNALTTTHHCAYIKSIDFMAL